MKLQSERPLSFWEGLERAVNYAVGTYLVLCVLESILEFCCNVTLANWRAKERRRRSEIRADQLARGLTEEEIEDEDWDAWSETHDLMPMEPEEYASLQELAEHEVRPGFLKTVGLTMSFLFLAACVLVRWLLSLN